MPDALRDQLALEYLEQLPYEPYPFQEQAILAWFESQQGVLVCAPTGMGKTLVAESALFEAIKTGRTAYYTTPLIALTEQKFRDLQEAAVRWGYEPTDVGLVTGNRRENPDAKLLVVVAEILFNRLLHPEVFDFEDVSAVVMDEFHSFNDPERGIVWELTLGLLPSHVRTLLISATVGNSYDFVAWLRNHHDRRLELVQSDERKVPLSYEWVEDAMLVEHLEAMAQGTEESRTTPALVFCFSRDECWNVADQIKGKRLITSQMQQEIVEYLKMHDMSQGAGPTLKQILQRGVGVHHAGVIPRYRRLVEDLFQRKMLAVAICTETLAAGINLPARSIVLPTIMKGPPGKKKLIEPSSAHQIFGRAGRPQYDDRGHIFALAHEDDVKMLRWRRQFEQIPEDTKDPKMLQMKKKLKRKMPKKRANEQYWTEPQFQKLTVAPSANLESRGRLPWRLLAYLLQASPEIDPIRRIIGRRLMAPKQVESGLRHLDRMLLTMRKAGFVTLSPEPEREQDRALHLMSRLHLQPNDNGDPDNETEDIPETSHLPEINYPDAGRHDVYETVKSFGTDSNKSHWGDLLGELGLETPSPASDTTTDPTQSSPPEPDESNSVDALTEPQKEPPKPSFGSSLNLNINMFSRPDESESAHKPDGKNKSDHASNDDMDNNSHKDTSQLNDEDDENRYRATLARPTPDLQQLLHLRSANPMYGMFLINQLGIASREERLMAFESVLEMPGSIARHVRPPRFEDMPSGPLARNRLDTLLLNYGLATVAELVPQPRDEEEDYLRFGPPEDRVWVLNLPDKLRRLFDFLYPGVEIRTTSVWVAGELLEFGGDFNKYITSKKLQKQEGMIFRHILRLILLLKEFMDICPPDVSHHEWRNELRDIVRQLSDCCRRVDSSSTDEMLDHTEETDDITLAKKQADQKEKEQAEPEIDWPPAD